LHSRLIALRDARYLRMGRASLKKTVLVQLDVRLWSPDRRVSTHKGGQVTRVVLCCVTDVSLYFPQNLGV